MNIKRLAATGVMLAMLLTGAVMAHGETAELGKPADLKKGMGEDCYVQEGSCLKTSRSRKAAAGD